jgi:hypothetical protein
LPVAAVVDLGRLDRDPADRADLDRGRAHRRGREGRGLVMTAAVTPAGAGRSGTQALGLGVR